MSFSQDTKQEITEKEPPKGCCASAAAYALLCFGKIGKENDFLIHTESKYLALYFKRIFSRCGIEGGINSNSSESLWEFYTDKSIILTKLYALFGHDPNEIAMHINGANFSCDKCISAFISTAFLCCGTITNPEKEYNLEFVSKRHSLMSDFEALLKGHGFSPRATTRKGLSILYFKNSEQIEDLLTFICASGAALEIMSRKVYKDFRNKANRITNCENANIDKIVEANTTVISAIEYLKKHDALDSLPQTVKQAAELRSQNPDLSLKELAVCFEPPLSKSGLCHRLKKIEQAANTLKERKKNV